MSFARVSQSKIDEIGHKPQFSAATLVPQGDDDGPPPQKKKKIGKRAGIPNYNDSDITKLLSIVEEVWPLVINAWASVSSKFNGYAEEEHHHIRYLESLRAKFELLANKKKNQQESNPSPY